MQYLIKRKENHFFKNHNNYYYVKHDGVWELFKHDVHVDEENDDRQLLYKRVVKGTRNKKESIKMFEKYLGGTIKNAKSVYNSR